METVLSVSSQDLSELTPLGAVRTFRDLLWAEANRLDIPLSKINVSERINVPDGGVDATIMYPEMSVGSGILFNGQACYQIKTGISFEPWQKSALQTELFGLGNQPHIGNLSDFLRNCLENQANYVLVCFGKDLTSQQRQSAIDNLRELFSECGFLDTEVDVWSQTQLIGFIQPFPALALKLNRRMQGSAVELHNEWAQHSDMKTNYEENEETRKLIRELKESLYSSTEPLHIRVLGEPGIGKTRFVFEATDSQKLRPLVIYADAAQFYKTGLIYDLTRSEVHAVLVLDECAPNLRTLFWNQLEAYSPRLKLITIYSEFENVGGLRLIELPPLSEEQVSRIIQSYGIPRDRSLMWAQECGGSPRVAHVIGINLRDYPEDVLKTPSTVNVWERYIQGSDGPTGIETSHRRLILQHIALFKRFGFRGSQSSEARYIANLVQQADPQITWARFQEIIGKLKRQKILQGSYVLYITPRLLHIWLWIQWWETYGNGFTPNQLQELPTSLQDWYFEMFEYAAGSEAAAHTARTLLDRNGPFQQDAEFLRSELGSRFFRYLAFAEPEAALKCLQTVIGGWNHDELIQFKTGRRNIVWALEEIVKWRTLFPGAARLLLRLAKAENETWSNNASGVFAGLFHLTIHPQLSPTEASPSERILILKDAIHSGSKQQRGIALNAFRQALTTYQGGMYSPHIKVVGRSPNTWIPSTWGELHEAYLLYWDTLTGFLDDLDGEDRQTAVEILLERASGLMRIEQLEERIVETIKALAKKEFATHEQVIGFILRHLKYHQDEMSDNIKTQLVELEKELTGDDLSSQLQRFVGMNLLEDKINSKLQVTNSLIDTIAELAHLAIQDPESLKPELKWLVTEKAKNGFIFGYELAKYDRQYTLLPLIANELEATIEDASAAFLGGYLRYISEQDQERWENTLTQISGKESLQKWVPELIWRSNNITSYAAALVLDIFQRKVVHISHMRMFSGPIRNMTHNDFVSWIEFLIDADDPWGAITALELFYLYYLNDASELTPAEDLTFRVLTNPILFEEADEFRQNQGCSYLWLEIMAAFVHAYPSRRIEIAEIYLKYLGKRNTIVDDLATQRSQLLSEIAHELPIEIWNIVKQHLSDPRESESVFQITEWLRGGRFWDEQDNGALYCFPSTIIWEWVDEDVDERAWRIAYTIPKELYRDADKTCWLRELLIRYGDREDVRNNLSANFSTEGWTGPASVHLQNKLNMLYNFRKEEDNGNVLQWIDDYTKRLKEDIEAAIIREEREGRY